MSQTQVSGNELTELQDFLWSYPTFPTLFVPHCIIMNAVLRSTLGSGWKNFSRKHPLSCYILGVIYTFPGGIIASMLLSEPLLEFLLNVPFMAAMTTAWYLVFFSPGDIFIRLIDALRLKLPLTMMQDFMRIQLVLSGVTIIHKSHPQAFLYPIVFAVCKSSGFAFFKYFEDILLNGLKKAFIIPHHSTKTCVLASVLFTAQALDYIVIDKKALYAGVVVLTMLLRLLTIITTFDPYAPFEYILCTIIFGRQGEYETNTSSPYLTGKDQTSGNNKKKAKKTD